MKFQMIQQAHLHLNRLKKPFTLTTYYYFFFYRLVDLLLVRFYLLGEETTNFGYHGMRKLAKKIASKKGTKENFKKACRAQQKGSRQGHPMRVDCMVCWNDANRVETIVIWRAKTTTRKLPSWSHDRGGWEAGKW